MRRVTIVVILGLLCACTATPPSRLTLKGEDEKAIILMKVVPAKIEYSLNIEAYDPATLSAEFGLFGSREDLTVKASTEEFVARKIKPGKYLFTSFIQQRQWAVCFHDYTLSFEVKPGEVLYLGDFSPKVHFEQLQAYAGVFGDRYADTDTLHHYLDGIAPPQIGSPQSRKDTLPMAEKFVRDSMPDVTANVRLADYKRARFEVSSTRNGERICG